MYFEYIILGVVFHCVNAAERKKELLPVEKAWMELEGIVLSEISQVAKDKYHMISPLNGT